MKKAFVILIPIVLIGAFVYLIVLDKAAQNQVQTKLTLQQEKAIANLGELQGDTNTIAQYMKDEQMMQLMKIVFTLHCASCHSTQGTGLAGPSLCDDSYITVKRLSDIFDVIEAGNIPKGMTPFKGVLSKTKIVLLSSYVANLRGSSSTGRISEGVLIDPWPQE